MQMKGVNPLYQFQVVLDDDDIKIAPMRPWNWTI